VDRRTRARQIAMQALYQLDVRGKDALGDIDGFFADSDCEQVCRDLAKKWCMGTWENIDQCDKLITESTMKWSLSRLSLVDKSILRLAVYQMRFCSDIPPKVAINEAIEIAKIFSGDKSPSFINGVLDAVLKKLTEKKQEKQEHKSTGV
jgi:transcription antitermination factor NusB